MTIYGGLMFFYILLVLLLPAIILGIFEKQIKIYGFIVTIIMIALLYGDSKKHFACLCLFYIGELILVKVYFLIVKRYHATKLLLWLFAIMSLIPLLLVKFLDVFKPGLSIGFLGISYLTFKAVQVIIEINDGLIKEVKIFDYTYFLLFFPTITSGPIDRSRRFIKEINTKMERSKYIDYIKTGIFKLFEGALYKFILGFLVNTYWIQRIPSTHTLSHTISYMYAYSFYLFFDFAGYSLMAVGTSYILGIATPDNFNLPFLSRSMKDFWNRWHITLSFWFRDFIYTRFVMSSIKAKRFKSRYTASYLGFLLTMGTMGLWHGTQANYIIYGLYQAALLILTDFVERKSKWYKNSLRTGKHDILFTILTFHLICFGFLIFSGYIIK